MKTRHIYLRYVFFINKNGIVYTKIGGNNLRKLFYIAYMLILDVSFISKYKEEKAPSEGN